MSMISVKGLKKSFKNHEVLKDINIEIQPGEVVAIIISATAITTSCACRRSIRCPGGTFPLSVQMLRPARPSTCPPCTIAT